MVYRGEMQEGCTKMTKQNILATPVKKLVLKTHFYYDITSTEDIFPVATTSFASSA